MSVTYVYREEYFVWLEVGLICKKEQDRNFHALKRSRRVKADVSNKDVLE
jgi:hypothetical protein